MSHLTSQVSQKDKVISDLRLQSSQSSSSQDRESLSAKEDQIENMEMEISKLRGDLEKADKNLAESQAKLGEGEKKIRSLEELHEAIAAELEGTKKELKQASERLVADGAAKNSAETLAEYLQFQLDAANSTIKTQAAAVSSWEKNYSTLKAMYRDSDAKTQEAQQKAAATEHENKDLMTHVTELRKRTMTLENENSGLRMSLGRSERGTGATQQDDDDVDELEDAERKKLKHRIQQLEVELFDERKKWHSSETQRLTLPDQGPTFLDVDLNQATVAGYNLQRMPRQQSQQGQQQQVRDMYAVEEEERRQQDAERIERVKDVKRGLVQWKGWRLDLTSVGGSGLNFGAMFEV